MDIPQHIRSNASALGVTGHAWLASLPHVVEAVRKTWGLTLGEPLAGGTEGFILNACDADGTHCVLKILPPNRRHEVRVLLAGHGRGYVTVLRHDATLGAVLLEKLGMQLQTQDLSLEHKLRIICSKLRVAWQVSDPHLTLHTGAEQAAFLAQFSQEAWRDLQQPCARDTLDYAVRCAAARAKAHHFGLAVVVHGDPHGLNTLVATPPDDYKFIDPDPFFAEPAYDLGVLMREWNAELLAGDAYPLGLQRCHLLAQLTDVDAEAIWQWGMLQRVSNGLLCLKVGAFVDAGRQALRIAELWCSASRAARWPSL